MCCCRHVGWHFIYCTQLAEGPLTTKILTQLSKSYWIGTCSILVNVLLFIFLFILPLALKKRHSSQPRGCCLLFFFENIKDNVIMEGFFWLLSKSNSGWPLQGTSYSPLEKLTQAFAYVKHYNNTFPAFSASAYRNNFQSAARLIVAPLGLCKSRGAFHELLSTLASLWKNAVICAHGRLQAKRYVKSQSTLLNGKVGVFPGVWLLML